MYLQVTPVLRLTALRYFVYTIALLYYLLFVMQLIALEFTIDGMHVNRHLFW